MSGTRRAWLVGAGAGLACLGLWGHRRAKARLSGKARPSFEEIWDDVQTSFRMVLAYARRDYREIPVKSIALIAASSIYFLLTFDVIPDFIPLIGFADDLSLYIWTLKQVHDDLEAFRTWERSGNV